MPAESPGTVPRGGAWVVGVRGPSRPAPYTRLLHLHPKVAPVEWPKERPQPPSPAPGMGLGGVGRPRSSSGVGRAGPALRPLPAPSGPAGCPAALGARGEGPGLPPANCSKAPRP